ncbi:MAG: asparaginase [Aquabacterium sp.]|nr:asparaginase [Aquabacterium sp.]
MQQVVILGTGGTIAGTGVDPGRSWQYQAAQLTVAQLVQAVPALSASHLDVVQVAQIDSKDMSWAVWRSLGDALQQYLTRDDVAGVVITHGTDTLEETAYLLSHFVDARKPVVLTAAMRPATAHDADGPGNLRDAVRVVHEAARRRLGGVVAVLHGRIWAAEHVRKAHTAQLDAFDGGGHAPLALVDEGGQWTAAAPAWPTSAARAWSLLAKKPPRVEVVHSHADADGWLLDAALAYAGDHGPLDGLVLAGTGHGTLHQGLEAAVNRARAVGVTVWRSSRVARGGVMSRDSDSLRAAGDLTVAQARVALMLYLLESK